ncbi:MAG TPA: Tex family protein [Phnomibacter sp.]|nr:Tex family protein [Phnomibacter sp.]
MLEYTGPVSAKLNLRVAQVEAVLRLLQEGATIPFIARYRKDQTGNLDEVQIAAIQDEAKFQKEFSERKAFIIKTIEEQGKMNDQLMAALDKATTLNELEDIYLPYKPKRKTKAQAARENGLEPLAQLLLAQSNAALELEAAKFINEKVASAEDALQGARDIIAEQVNEDATVRTKMRRLFETEGLLISKVLSGKETEAAKYKDYFDYSEPVSKVPAHRALAVLRGFMEGFLRISIEPAEEAALELLEEQFIQGMSNEGAHVKKALRDAWKRLLQPSLESEFRMAVKTRSDEEAINVFAENLRQLLLSSPLGGKHLLAIDPGYRTGCKTVVLDNKGDLKTNTVIYLHEPNRLYEAEKTIRHLVAQYGIEVIAIGDGTAGRETEKFIKGLQLGLPVFLVNEDGASVYSASEVAREEFPNEDVTVRGAVSIGRRLMDPLAELVKIDPKSIGVGQYQHDVNQVRLKEKLDQTVESCVNLVGVNINTASRHLLSYVSGIGETIARNIVDFRRENGMFSSRVQLKKVPRLGEKAFEQCAGFLRIANADNPLDNSAVHPESYEIVNHISKDLGVTVKELVGNDQLVKKVNAKQYAGYGELRVQDILKELAKPGLDPRAEAESFEFANIYSLEEVQAGMELPGIVTNLTKFGAFVDIGVKQDGLVHVSEIANRYISDPAEVLKLGQKVKVKVLEIDLQRKRIALSIKQTEPAQAPQQRREIRPGAKPQQANSKPQSKDLSNLDMQDALAALKNKFGK